MEVWAQPTSFLWSKICSKAKSKRSEKRYSLSNTQGRQRILPTGPDLLNQEILKPNRHLTQKSMELWVHWSPRGLCHGSSQRTRQFLPTESEWFPVNLPANGLERLCSLKEIRSNVLERFGQLDQSERSHHHENRLTSVQGQVISQQDLFSRHDYIVSQNQTPHSPPAILQPDLLSVLMASPILTHRKNWSSRLSNGQIKFQDLPVLHHQVH